VWGELLEDLLDLAGQRVSISTDAIVVSGVRVNRTVLFSRCGRRWARVELGENVVMLFCEQGLVQCGWIEDPSQPEREAYAVIDRGGERELMIVLEREQ
jgi:hypothetical protein